MFERFKHFFAHDEARDPLPLPFDYDLVLLDAGELAEGGILEAYEQLHPQLRQHQAAEIEIAEDIDDDTGAYTVFADGARYDIYGADVKGDAWTLATIAFFEIVNAALAQTTYRFYALYAGNDLAGVFLTEDQFRIARERIAQRSDWPWTPVNRAPDFGFPAYEIEQPA